MTAPMSVQSWTWTFCKEVWICCTEVTLGAQHYKTLTLNCMKYLKHFPWNNSAGYCKTRTKGLVSILALAYFSLPTPAPGCHEVFMHRFRFLWQLKKPPDFNEIALCNVFMWADFIRFLEDFTAKLYPSQWMQVFFSKPEGLPKLPKPQVIVCASPSAWA